MKEAVVNKYIIAYGYNDFYLGEVTEADKVLIEANINRGIRTGRLNTFVAGNEHLGWWEVKGEV